MGLAASQARFLGITARKSNIEYEGQQVNQQRTALAEEVNALYNKLLAIKVPVAPDTTQFYESDYAFTVSNNSDYQGDYIIKSYLQNNEKDNGVPTYYLTTERTYVKNIAVGVEKPMSSITKEGDTYKYTDDAGMQYDLQMTKNEEMVNRINSTYSMSLPADQEFGVYQSQSDADKGMTYYIPFPLDESQQTFSVYNFASKTTTDVQQFPSATMTTDQNGRISKLYHLMDENGNDVLKGSTVGVDTKRVYDSEGYDAALRDYTMSKEEYDKKVADLNAQTESLQQEDKVLEMRLNQIDTEQNELQTELDAVKAILDKNIEKTFNTFS